MHFAIFEKRGTGSNFIFLTKEVAFTLRIWEFLLLLIVVVKEWETWSILFGCYAREGVFDAIILATYGCN